MSGLFGRIQQLASRLLRGRFMQYDAWMDLKECSVMLVGPSLTILDGGERGRFGDLVRFQQLEQDLDGLRLRMEAFGPDPFLLFQQVAVLRLQLSIMEGVNGKIVQVCSWYVIPDYTERIESLEERLASFAHV